MSTLLCAVLPVRRIEKVARTGDPEIGKSGNPWKSQGSRENQNRFFLRKNTLGPPYQVTSSVLARESLGFHVKPKNPGFGLFTPNGGALPCYAVRLSNNCGRRRACYLNCSRNSQALSSEVDLSPHDAHATIRFSCRNCILTILGAASYH